MYTETIWGYGSDDIWYRPPFVKVRRLTVDVFDLNSSAICDTVDKNK